jgi:hypothetical protein
LSGETGKEHKHRLVVCKTLSVEGLDNVKNQLAKSPSLALLKSKCSGPPIDDGIHT